MADLDPAHGTEPGKVRPVLVVQTDLLNRVHPSTVVLPLTTKIEPHGAPLRVRLAPGEAHLAAVSEIILDQIRAVDNRRFRRAVGAVTPRRMAEVERTMALLLDLPGAV